MTTQIHLDILAKVDAQANVTYWRPEAFGEPSSTPTEKFGTGSRWVELSGSTFTGLLGSEHRPQSVQVSLTVFGDASFTVVGVHGMTPSGSWKLNGSDSDPSSPTYDSSAASFDNNFATTVSFKLQLATGSHVLTLNLTSVEDDPDDVGAGNEPIDPIIIADVPKPPPNPVTGGGLPRTSTPTRTLSPAPAGN